jgi:hypothetical protein
MFKIDAKKYLYIHIKISRIASYIFYLAFSFAMFYYIAWEWLIKFNVSILNCFFSISRLPLAFQNGIINICDNNFIYTKNCTYADLLLIAAIATHGSVTKRLTWIVIIFATNLFRVYFSLLLYSCDVSWTYSHHVIDYILWGIFFITHIVYYCLGIRLNIQHRANWTQDSV